MNQYNLSEREADDEDEAVQKTQHKKAQMRQDGAMRNIALNPEHLYEFCDSPFQGNDVGNQGDDDESITMTLS
jgi:hypothetical protein